MWTHREPFEPLEFTRESIEQRGRLGLSRALNIGRVIGFIGSGATRAYGRPSWDKLVDKAIEIVLSAELNEPFERQSARRLVSQLRTIRGAQDDETPARLLLALSTAEDLAEKLGRLAQVRDKIAEMIAKPRKEARDDLTKDLVEIRSNDAGIAELGIGDPGIQAGAQPLEAVIKDLRINRFLTLNYDLEIEREFQRWFRTTSAEAIEQRGDGETGSDFNRLCECSRDDHLLASLPHSVSHVDGTRRSVKSVTMHAQNIGDLVNFAMHPRSFEAQVFHLHGRCDKPRDMVLTEKDYQRIYLGSGEQQHTFDEALSAIFSGNEVLFIGVGLKEADMLRPLRQFVSQDRKPDMAKQPVYALMERDCRLSLDLPNGSLRRKASFFEGSIRMQQQNPLGHDIFPEQGAAGENPDGALPSKSQTAIHDRIAENARSLDLKSQYGVHSVFYGDQMLRNVRLAAMLIKELAKIGRVRLKGDPGAAESLQDQEEDWAVAWRCTSKHLSPNDGKTLILAGGESKNAIDDCAAWSAWLAKMDAIIEKRGSRLSLNISSLGEDDCAALEIFAEAFEGEMRARGLERGLRQLATRRDRWWRDWRKIPRSRRAQYAIRSRISEAQATGAGDAAARWSPDKDIEIQSRHRPRHTRLIGALRYQSGHESFKAVQELRRMGIALQKDRKERLDAHYRWENKLPLSSLAEALLKTQYMHGDPHGVRLLRCVVPRGGGKGALLHILQEFTTKKETGPQIGDRPILSEIFEPFDENFRYKKAFCIHLSFSMEFASVIEALRRFFKDALTGLMYERYDRLQAYLKSPERREDGHFFSQLEAIMPGLANLESDKVRVERFVNVAKPSDRQPNRQRQQHRVDRLRHFMELYRDLAVWLDGPKGLDAHRVFVCFSGLDILCDSNGVARNPMFRAFFRLLTGCEQKRPEEAPERMPMDLLLISGQPEVPIRYLSEHSDVEEAKANVGKTTADSEYRILPGETLALKKWEILPSMRLEERYWLCDQDVASKNVELPCAQRGDWVRVAIHWALTDDARTGGPPKWTYIRGLVEDSVALSTWVFGIARLLEPGVIEGTEETLNEAKEKSAKFLDRVDAAAARSGANGALRALFNIYEENIAPKTTLDSSRQVELSDMRDRIFHLASFKKLKRTKDKKAAEIAGNKQLTAADRLQSLLTELKNDDVKQRNRQRQIAKLALQHLAAFPMPVEARVLYGCPEVKAILADDLRNAWRDEAQAVQENAPKNKGLRDRLRKKARAMRWQSRELFMEELQDTLQSMHKVGLIIEVDPKRSASVNDIAPPDPVTGLDKPKRSHHLRYTVHAQMRDFLAHHMRFFSPDRGERNYFQVSLYCDQPRDLPTPTQDHYRMFRSILNEQIATNQRTLWHFYQIWRLELPTKDRTAEPYAMSFGEQSRFEHGLRRRLMRTVYPQLAKGGKVSEEFDDELISIHAIPQRIRALYGLLRTGFSIGAISRLSRFDDDQETDQPYESFRGWLRGLTNAAIAMDERWDEILDVSGHKQNDYGLPEPKTASAEHPNVVNVNFKTLLGKSNVKPIMNAKPVKAPPQPLYRDEIGWLINERGLISLVQGHLYDAIPLFERALIVMRHAANGNRDDPALHAATRRVRLNLAIAQIDRGNLYKARRIIEELQTPEGLSGNFGSVVNEIGRGYLGLIDHLSGHFASAQAKYEELVRWANDRQMLRLVSIFNRHLADLQRTMGQKDTALATASLAINAAMQAEQRDILHAARLSQAKIRMRSDADDSDKPRDFDMSHVERCQNFATEMGTPRLETEALRVQAHAMLLRGERVMAGQIATRAAAVAARGGLRLHKLSALSIYAKALQKRNQVGLSRDVLLEARAEAERLGFQTRAGELGDNLVSNY